MIKNHIYTETMETINYVGYLKNYDGKIVKYIENVSSERGNDFKGTLIVYGYVYPYGSQKSNKLAWFRVDNPRNIYDKSNYVWEEGTVRLKIHSVSK